MWLKVRCWTCCRTPSLSNSIVVHEASEEDTDRAVAAAKAAFPKWSTLSPDQRAQYFKKLAKLIRENNDELGALEAASMGKPLGAFFDAYACAAKWERYSEAAYTVQGTTSVQTPGYLNLTLRQPYGVVAAIIPWNVPLLFLASKLAPALIVGNTVVLKSSEKAPLTVSKMGMEITCRCVVKDYSGIALGRSSLTIDT